MIIMGIERFIEKQKEKYDLAFNEIRNGKNT